MRRFQVWSRTLVLAVAAACSSSNPPAQSGTTIGQGGGTVTSSDGKVSLLFPAGALAQDTRIDIKPVTTPAENYLVAGTHYDPARLPSGADENRLQVVKLRTDGQRRASSSTVDTSAHTVAAQITGFSTWSVACCIPPRTPTDFFGTYDAPNGVIHLTWNLVLLGGLNPTSELRIERAEVILPLDSDYHPFTTLTEASPGFASGIDDPGSGVFHPNLPVWYRLSGAAGIYVDAPVTTFVLIPTIGTITLTATAASTTSILLSWNNIPDVVSYQLERDSGSGFSVIAGPANTALQYTDTGLTPSTFYTYRLTANLSAGATSVATAGATTLGSVVSSHIYVTDSNPATGAHRVVRMDDIAGAGWKTLTGAGTDHFTSPSGIAVDAAGLIYVADGARIVQTDIDGVGWKTLSQNLTGTDHFTGLEGIALDGAGNIYVSDYGGPTTIARIVKTDINGSTWTVLGTTMGSGASEFFCPGQIHVDANFIHVADRCNNRIVRMTDMSGGGWTPLLTKAGGGDHFSSPRGITVDASGVIWVGDELNARLVQTAIDGTNWAVTPLPLSLSGFPANPTTLAFSPSGALYVTGFHSGYLAEVVGGTTTLFTTEPHGDAFSHAFGVAVGP